MKLPWLKRPSLLWMSSDDVKAVRDKIIGLYLLPADFVEYEGVKLYGGAIPCFERRAGCEVTGFRTERAHFKYTRDFPPMWDLQYLRDKDANWSKIKTVHFSHFDVLWAAQLVKAWHKKFPFKPTDNFLRDIDTIDPREDS